MLRFQVACSLMVGVVGGAACSDGRVVAAGPTENGGSTAVSTGGSGGTAPDGGGAPSDGGKTPPPPHVDGGARVLPDGGIVPPSGKSAGETCSATVPCRLGLSCTSGKCAFDHAGKAGSSCVASDECASGLRCVGLACVTTGTGVADAACTSDVDCASGLRCGIVGFAAECVAEGTSDVGQSCGTSLDCASGLLCAPGSGDAGAAACAPIPPGAPPFGVPVAPALNCTAPSKTNVTAYFEVPQAKGSAANGDFFRLPFPNDARITGGKIDLTGFPTPGSSLLGFDPVKIYLDAIVANQSAWGTSPSVLFRFSGPIDFDTFRATGTTSPVQFVDITDPKNPTSAGAQWAYSSAPGKYICDNWLGVRRPLGAPLTPGHVYAAYLTTVGRDASGLAITRAPELVSLLAATAPADTALANAYAAYKPFRDYLTDAKVLPTTVLDAAVFTAGPAQTPMASLAAAVKAATAPTAAGWVKCVAGATSPCPQADGDRACGTGTADYDEYHALITLPIFQKGTEPYLASGGDIAATPVRTEAVCASLTVPKSAEPAAGYPLVVYAHGTGGSFRDHVRPEVAGVLATATPPMAVLGYDQVEHGTRRGASTASPDDLFFNFRNPAAARGNPMQGAADVVSVGRLAKALAVPAVATGAAAIKINGAAVVFFGHSQGSLAGSLGLPFTNDYTAAVLSGNGASLMEALLNKTSPQNIAAAVPFLLGGDYDGTKLAGGEYHPVLSIVQQWIDPADPLNFAQSIGKVPETGITPKSVFETYGLGDTYAPPITLQAYSLAAGLSLAAHDATATKPDAIGNLAEVAVPLTGDFATGGHTVTLGVREYGPPKGDDGHFVVFDVPSANADAVRFIAAAAAKKVPPIGQ